VNCGKPLPIAARETKHSIECPIFPLAGDKVS
jgi:hypothetical protein